MARKTGKKEDNPIHSSFSPLFSTLPPVPYHTPAHSSPRASAQLLPASHSPLLPVSHSQLFAHLIALMREQTATLERLARSYTPAEETVPAEIFAQKLSPSEAVCKYLKENRKKSFHEIAVLLNRDDRSIWTSYRRASKKQPFCFRITQQTPSIPLSALANRPFSFLESVILHLFSAGITPAAIARLLHRSAPIIHTVLGRVRAKQARKEKQEKQKEKEKQNEKETRKKKQKETPKEQRNKAPKEARKAPESRKETGNKIRNKKTPRST